MLLSFLLTETYDNLSRIINQMYRSRKLNEEKGSVQNYSAGKAHTSSYNDTKIMQGRNVIQKGTATCKNLTKQSDKTGQIENRLDNRNNKDLTKTDDLFAIGNKIPKGNMMIHRENENTKLLTDYKIKSTKSENDSAIDENIDTIISEIIETYVHTLDEGQQNMIGSCLWWDFAGKDDFYATHQMFLSKNAVYILVTDSLDLSMHDNTFDDPARKLLELYTLSSQYIRRDTMFQSLYL